MRLTSALCAVCAVLGGCGNSADEKGGDAGKSNESPQGGDNRDGDHELGGNNPGGVTNKNVQPRKGGDNKDTQLSPGVAPQQINKGLNPPQLGPRIDVNLENLRKYAANLERIEAELSGQVWRDHGDADPCSNRLVWKVRADWVSDPFTLHRPSVDVSFAEVDFSLSIYTQKALMDPMMRFRFAHDKAMVLTFGGVVETVPRPVHLVSTNDICNLQTIIFDASHYALRYPFEVPSDVDIDYGTHRVMADFGLNEKNFALGVDLIPLVMSVHSLGMLTGPLFYPQLRVNSHQRPLMKLFALSTPFVDSHTGYHIAYGNLPAGLYEDSHTFALLGPWHETGNIRTMSRRDDMYAVAALLMLSYAEVHSAYAHNWPREEVVNMALKRMPTEWVSFYQYVVNMKFEEEPKYSHWRAVLGKVVSKSSA